MDDQNLMQTKPDEPGDNQVLLGNEEDESISELIEQNSVTLREQGIDPDELTDEERADILSDVDEDNDDPDSRTLSDVVPPESQDEAD